MTKAPPIVLSHYRVGRAAAKRYRDARQKAARIRARRKERKQVERMLGHMLVAEHEDDLVV